MLYRERLDNASLFGTVSDPCGALLAGARINIINLDTADTITVQADSKRDYFAPVLPVGKYRVTVLAHGLRTQVLKDVVLRSSDRVRLNVTLQVGEATDSITVTGAAPLVDTGSSTMASVVGTQQLNPGNPIPQCGRDARFVRHAARRNPVPTVGCFIPAYLWCHNIFRHRLTTGESGCSPSGAVHFS